MSLIPLALAPLITISTNCTTAASSDHTYLVFEGDSQEFPSQLTWLKSVLGPEDGSTRRLYALGIGTVPLLTRSTQFLSKEIDAAFDLAEHESVPVYFHLDPMYGFLADTESRPEDAPATKYWKNPKMREWLEFPTGGQLPTRIPRPWFNWGSWVSPAPALPAFGSPDFIHFARLQMREGIANPICRRLSRLRHIHKEWLFAGINVGWETHFLDNRGIDGNHLPEAVWPLKQRGARMQTWEVGGQTGFASLYWSGWTQERLYREAIRRGVALPVLRDSLFFGIVHDYMQSLAQSGVLAGLRPAQIFTHIVAISTAHPELTDTFRQPTWVAVNRYSTPGFTMDNRGAAVYNLTVLKSQILAADPSQHSFGAIESYLSNTRDEASCRDSLHETFDNGGAIKVLFGAFQKGTPFALDPNPEGATRAILDWLRGD
jgi:hypothetical protein